jgi:tetratricopeptide (TPR) repeat protein
LHYLYKALEQAQTTGSETAIGNIYVSIGYAHRRNNDLEQAETCARQAEVIFHKFSDLPGLAQVWDNLGTVYLHQQKWEDALHYLEKAQEMWRTLGIEPNN